MFVAFVCLWREGACTDHMLLSAGIPAHSTDVFVHLRRAVCREECREDACFLFLASFRKFRGKKIKKALNPSYFSSAICLSGTCGVFFI